MKRKILTGVVATTGFVVLAAAVIAGHGQRSAQAESRADRVRAQANVKRAAAAEPITRKSTKHTRVCPRGAEGLGNSARRSIARKLLDEEGRVDLGALAEMSNIALASARYLERARAAPAVPQRLGRARVPSDEGTTWQAIAYPKIGCATVARTQP